MYKYIKVLLVVVVMLVSIEIVSATTLLYEDFEAATYPPAGWDTVKTVSCRAWVRRTSGQVFRVGGSAGVCIANYAAWGSITGTSYLKTQALNFSSAGIESLSFYFRLPGLTTEYGFASNLDTLKVEVSINGAIWTPVLVLDSNYLINLPRQEAIRDTGYKLTTNLSAFNGQPSVYIRWILYDNYPGNVGTNRYFNIDSIYVYDRPAGLEENISSPINQLTFEVYPNPFKKNVTVRFNIANEYIKELKIYDISGTVVRTFSSISTNTISWNGNDQSNHLVAPGVYFIVLETNNRNKVVKVLLSN